jgi:hypothetical protein
MNGGRSQVHRKCVSDLIKLAKFVAYSWPVLILNDTNFRTRIFDISIADPSSDIRHTE